jgi:hypothetical protein
MPDETTRQNLKFRLNQLHTVKQALLSVLNGDEFDSNVEKAIERIEAAIQKVILQLKDNPDF